MKHIIKLSCAAVLSCASFISSAHGAVSAKIEVSASKTSDTVQAILDQDEKPRALFYLDLLKAKELNDDDFAAWYNKLSDNEQTLVQYVTQLGIVDEIDAIKNGATRVSTKRQIFRGIAALIGAWLGASVATDGFDDEHTYKLLSMDGVITLGGACTGWTAEELTYWIYQNSKWLWSQEQAFSDRLANIVDTIESKI